MSILTEYNIIVGLGNPEEKFSKTFHNVGFMFLDFLKEKFADFFPDEFRFQKGKKFLFTKSFKKDSSEETYLLKPMTYMNKSGEALLDFIKFFKIENLKILVACDSIDHVIGKVKITSNLAPKSHNGIESIKMNLGRIEKNVEKVEILKIGILKEEYKRFYKGKFDDMRIGLLSDYVLRKMSSEEEKKIIEGFECLIKGS